MTDPKYLTQVLTREANYARNTKALDSAGVSYTPLDGGKRLLIEGKYDFWPSTGVYISRVTKKKHHGLNALLKELYDHRNK